MPLHDDATLFALSFSGRVWKPFYQKTKNQLQRMEILGVISPVEKPTPWCAPIVVFLR